MLLRSALEQKKIDEIKEYESIDYDALVESDRSTVGLGTKVIPCIDMYFNTLTASWECLSFRSSNSNFFDRLE